MKDYSIYELRKISEAYRSMNENDTIKLYRGIDGKYSDNDGVVGDASIWTTDDIGYAKVYAVDKKEPTIIEFEIDSDVLNCATLGHLDGLMGYEVEPAGLLDGFDDRETEKLLTNGFNAVYFDWEGHGIYLLLNRDMIVSKRILAREEYDEVELDESVVEAYNPRDYLPKVKGGWTKDKIKRYMRPSLSGIYNAAKLIAEYDSPEDLKKHMFFHGSPYGTSKGMIPSIKQRVQWVERNGSGGSGERYWGISVTPSKKIASNFSGASSYMSIYPILLAKNAVIEDAPQFHDANEIEDYIEDYWNRGVDAVTLGGFKEGTGEQELLILNPRAICNIGAPEFYDVYRLGQEENPIRFATEDDITAMYEFAKEFANEHSPSGQPFDRPTSFYSSVDSTMKYAKDGKILSKEEYDSALSDFEKRRAAYFSSPEYMKWDARRQEAKRRFRF